MCRSVMLQFHHSSYLLLTKLNSNLLDILPRGILRHWLLDFQYELRDQFKKHSFIGGTGGLSGGVVNDDWTIGLRTCCNHKLNRGVGPDREIEGWCGDKHLEVLA